MIYWNESNHHFPIEMKLKTRYLGHNWLSLSMWWNILVNKLKGNSFFEKNGTGEQNPNEEERITQYKCGKMNRTSMQRKFLSLKDEFFRQNFQLVLGKFVFRIRLTSIWFWMTAENARRGILMKINQKFEKPMHTSSIFLKEGIIVQLFHSG